VKRPSKKEIKLAIEKLNDKSSGSSEAPEPKVGKLASKKTSQRIRKQGV